MKLISCFLCCLLLIILISGCTTLSDKAKLDSSLESYYRGLDYEKASNYSDAIKEYETSNELSPRPIVNYKLGQIYEKQGELDEAIKFYEKAIELSSSYDDAHYSLAFAYAKKGWRNKALAEWEKFRENVQWHKVDSKWLKAKKEELIKELRKH